MYVSSLTEIKKFLKVLAPFFLGSIIKQAKKNAILKKRFELFCANLDEISITNIAGRISTKGLEYPFVVLDRLPPFT